MAQDKAIAHLEEIRKDLRDEIKKRIEQRDKYSIQLTIALGAIVALSFSPSGFGRALLAAPLVSIYFTVLILYSYRVHRVIARYMREKLEPELARLSETPAQLEWERYYQSQEVHSIRRLFFMSTLWVICISSLLYLWMTESSQPEFRAVLIFATVIYIIMAIMTTIGFWRK